MNYLINLNLRLTNHVDYQAIILLGTFHPLIRKEKHLRIRPNPVVLFNFGLKSSVFLHIRVSYKFCFQF